MRVFDISEWQSDNTIQKIKDLGAEGVILRIGVTIGGRPDLDQKFIRFVNDAVAAGIPYGIYYYNKMHDYDSALTEIQWINDRVYEYLNGQEPPLGVWLDIEDEQTKFTGIHDVVLWAIKTMQGWGFKKVGIYSGYYFFKDFFNLTDLAAEQIPIWCATYNSVNYLKEEWPELNWYGWQFTDKYDGNSLDGNEWYKA